MNRVLDEVEGADGEAVLAAFKRYQEEFSIPPVDAFRSVMRQFLPKEGPAATGGGSPMKESPPSKKVNRLSELGSDDRNVEIEVKILTNNQRTQTVRGEERQIAFGLLHDDPWGEGGGEPTRWEYKDWGPSEHLRAGAIVRIEGASVNEFRDKRSLNINQSTRVVVLQEGEVRPTASEDPVPIERIADLDGDIEVIAMVLDRAPDVIRRRDGSGTIDVVRGRLGDRSGTIGFLSWEPFEYEPGTVLRIASAQIKRFRDTPELNFGRATRFERFHDATFPSRDELDASARATIAELRDGSRDVSIEVQVHQVTPRSFTDREGKDRTVLACDVLDPTGRCRMTAWGGLPFESGDVPVTIRIERARIRAWQGVPDITLDSSDQVTVLDSPSWGEVLDAATLSVEEDLSTLARGPSRVGITTMAEVVSVREDCGFVDRCSTCRRVVREGSCQDHPESGLVVDVRLRFVLDDGRHSANVNLNALASATLLGLEIDDLKERIKDRGTSRFVAELRAAYLGRSVTVSGRTLVDEQGMMLLADSMAIRGDDPALKATELRTRWGLDQ